MGFFDSLFGSRPTVHPTPVSDETFRDEVLSSDKPVLVDFTSTTCAPCQRLLPVLTDVQTRYPDDIKIAVADVAKNRQIAAKLGVRSTPTLVLFRDGEELGRTSGFKPRSYWEGMIRHELRGADEA